MIAQLICIGRLRLAGGVLFVSCKEIYSRADVALIPDFFNCVLFVSNDLTFK